jgi:tRNA(Ile)-lysidine synthase
MSRIGAPWPGAVAVSGGGDSVALMHLLRDWAKRRAPPIVLTVDHGLQPGSAAAARKVVRWARALGLKAHALTFNGTRPEADIEAAAREARYRLMGDWCREHGIGALYVAHTRDDQAETFLLRLARGSGLDGLAAMRPLAPYPIPGFTGLAVVRPLLAMDRAMLREHLQAREQPWLEDAMNADPRFDRVRIRAALATLQDAGLTAARIADAAAHLGRAREALDTVTEAVLARACRIEGGAALVEAPALLAAPREIGLRALAALLMAVSGQAYRPRFERLERLFNAIAQGKIGAGRTLHGCRIAPLPRQKTADSAHILLIARESARTPAEK